MFDWSTLLHSTRLTPSQPSPPFSAIPLLDQLLISVSGADAETFLQGQCTCDFRRLQQQQWLRGAHCNPKGRIIFTFVAARLDDESIGLRVHQSTAELALAALKKYAVFSKVVLRLRGDIALLALSDAAPALGLPNPDAGHFAPCAGGVMLASVSAHSELWLAGDSLHALAPGLPLAGDNADWRLANIRLGQAEIQQPLSGLLLPQEINYQLVDGVAFNKGCYTGQEIVARMHYRAHLKKHLFRARAHSAVDPALATGLYDSEQPEGAKGLVVNAARSSAETVELLVLCDAGLTASKRCVLEQHPAAKVEWLSLPYAIS